MDEVEKVSYMERTCKNHAVLIPKDRWKPLYGQLHQHLGEIFGNLAQLKKSRIKEGHLRVDHVHMTIVMPPKYVVSQVVSYIKGKSAIHLAWFYGERKHNFVGQHFGARGYFVLTTGRDEAVIRAYIKNREQEYQRLKQLNLWRGQPPTGGPITRGRVSDP